MFIKEKTFGNDRVYRINRKTFILQCTATTALYSPENRGNSRFIDLRLAVPEDLFDIVALETRVCQELFPKHTFCYPFDAQRNILPHVKLPTHYGHIQIPITNKTGTRMNSHEIKEGTDLIVEIQPKSAWSLDQYCGISWTLHTVKIV